MRSPRRDAGVWQDDFRIGPASRHRVDVDDPFNQHVMRDVEHGNLASCVVALVALLTGGVWLARATGLAAVAANLPNRAHHQLHVDVLPTVSDQILQTITLSLVSVTAILVAALAFRLPSGRRRRCHRPPPHGRDLTGSTPAGRGPDVATPAFDGPPTRPPCADQGCGGRGAHSPITRIPSVLRYP
jgi:hypothetical protein